MKLNECSFPNNHVETCGVSIATIWDVHADRSYDIPIHKSRRDSMRLSSESGEGKILIRSLAGGGWIRMRSGKRHVLGPETLFLSDFEEIVRYGSGADEWRFWWFEFYSHSSLHIIERAVIDCPQLSEEDDLFKLVKSGIRSKQVNRIHLATAQFIRLLYGWWSDCGGKAERDVQSENIDIVIEMMYQSLDQPFAIEHFARAIGMSTSGFRTAFKRISGKSPKTYYDHIRLHTAYQLLQQGNYSIGEIARQVGYDNQFYFSSAFKRHFGCPPSKV
jgi:AraC-like DNA-binding protein